MTIRLFGAHGDRLARALNAVVDCFAERTVGRGANEASPYAVLLDAGDFETVSAAAVTVRFEASHGRLTGILYVPISVTPVVDASRIGVDVSRVTKLLPRLASRPVGTPDAKARQHLSHLTSQLARAVALTNDGPVSSDHTEAIKALWTTPVRLNPKPVRARVVIVDDDAVFRAAIGDRLSDACEVKLFARFADYKAAQRDGSIWRAEEVDLFIIGIVETDSKGSPQLVGLEDILPELRRDRGLSDFPQIYVVSELPSSKAAHLALGLGADYYMEKLLLLAHPEPLRLLGDLLGHTTAGVSHLRGTVTLPKSNAIGSGWPEDDDQTPDLELARRMTWALYARQHTLSSINLLDRLQEGRSGAVVLAVQPVLAPSSRASIEPPRAMAPRIVKKDRWRKMAREWTNYRRHVAPLTSGGFARIEDFFHRADDQAVISYTLAGAADAFALGRVQTLPDVLAEGRHSPVELTEALFRQVLRPLHESANAPRSLRDVVAYMAGELESVPASLFEFEDSSAQQKIIHSEITDNRLRLAVVSIDNGQDGFPAYVREIPLDQLNGTEWLFRQERTFRARVQSDLLLVDVATAAKGLIERVSKDNRIKNRLTFAEARRQRYLTELGNRTSALMSTLNTLVTACSAQSAPTAYWGVIHGDLTVANVLHAADSNTLWLIDFAKTRFGPPALDYVVFEISCRLSLLVPPLCNLLARKIEKSRSGKDSNDEAERWFEAAVHMISWFESETVDTRRVAPDLLKCFPDERDRQRFLAGWQAILVARRTAFDSFYRGSDGRTVYDLLLTLHCLWALQRHWDSLTAPEGPLGPLWVLHILERTLKAPSLKRLYSA